jgi:dihydrodipicolinate synthase/N-acetylneuraminate lyase
MTAPFGRVLTAMVTPFEADGSVDLKQAAALADRLVAEGNDGLVVSGTTGEAPTTHRNEKVDLLRAVVDAVGGRAQVLAGVGSNDTAHAVLMAQDAEKAGATGLLSVTPYYSKPPQAETDLAVYSGTDALNLPLLSIGAVGMVSVISHVVTPRLVEMVKAYDAGDVARAAGINLSLEPVWTGMFRTQGAILSKAALALLGFPVGGMRLPQVEATPEQVAQLRADLVAGGVLPS